MRDAPKPELDAEGRIEACRELANGQAIAALREYFDGLFKECLAESVDAPAMRDAATAGAAAARLDMALRIREDLEAMVAAGRKAAVE